MKKRRPAPGEIIPSGRPPAMDGSAVRNLTPARLAGILRALDEGETAEAMALFDEMAERDLHLGAVTQTRLLAAASRERDVIPASSSDEDERIALFVREALDNIPRRRELAASLMSAVTHGFAVAEILWDASEGTAVIKDILPRPQALFTFADPEEPGRLRGFPAWVSPEGRAVDLPREKFILHSAGRGPEVFLKTGLYRGISWYYLFTNFTIKDWLSFMDVYGIPLRLGKYKKTADEGAREALRRAVSQLGSDAAAVISEDTTIEFIHSALAGDHKLFREAAEFFNRQKSKRLLGQTLTTEGGQGSGSSYALGRVHERVRSDIVAYDCGALDETLTQDIVRPLVDFNFGPRKRYPKIITRLSSHAEAEARLEQARRLVEMGAKVPARVFAEITGVPILGDLDETLTGAPAGAGEASR
ncbi:MAG: phage portal protein family protein [Candidatus Nitrospinota bacterium M3_3B_026]